MNPISLPPLFVRRMQGLLGADYAAFACALTAAPFRRGLRVNTLKMPPERLLALYGDALPSAPFCAAGYYVEREDWRPLFDPLHHAGAYYMQEPSAMSAVTALAPQPGERVLDLCAAPGGKSTQIAAALQGQGLLWSNEFVRSRAQVLAQNLERCGVRNAVVSNGDTAVLGDALGGWFDAVLVDAPCSGEGMFRKEAAALEGWSEDNIALCAARQRTILDAAAKTVREGGRLVYATCTFAPEENECMMAWFLRAHPDFEAVDLSGVGFGRAAFDWEQVAAFAPADVAGSGLPLSYARRILPQDGGAGHFVALFRRVSPPETVQSGTFIYPRLEESCIKCEELYRECFSDVPNGRFAAIGGGIRLLPEDLPPMTGLGVLGAGVAAAEIQRSGRLEPCHALFMAAQAAHCRAVAPLEGDAATAFLHGETVPCDPALRGWTAATVAGVTVGFGKAVNGTLKNHYPKGLRLRE